MAQGAHVTSVESIQAFRADLILYLSQARPTLEEVSADVVRTRVWLQHDQRLFWENQVRRRQRELEQAQQALFSAGIANLREATDVEKMAVLRARRALEEAEAKLKTVKNWSREFDNRTDPLVKQLEQLHTLLCQDMLKATADLDQALKALTAYAELAPPDTSGETSAPSGPAPGPESGLSQEAPGEPAPGGGT